MRKHLFTQPIIEETLGELEQETIELQSYFKDKDENIHFQDDVYRYPTPEEIIAEQKRIIKEAEKRIRFIELKKCQRALQELESNKNNESALEGLFHEYATELEAIIFYKLRPALTICRTADGENIIDEDLSDLGHADGRAEQKWEKILVPVLKNLFWTASRTGRIETGKTIFPAWLGSAFLFSENGHMMTNRHVLTIQDFCWHDSDQNVAWSKQVPHLVNFDALYLNATGNANSVKFKEVPYLAHPGEYDCGVIRLDEKYLSKELKKPIPLYTGELSKDELKGRLVCVIGHPGFDQYADGAERDYVFRGIYSKKRIMPGRLLGINEDRTVMYHDCSTLGGASGSCIIDLEEGESFGKIIGLHWGGVHGEQNYATPIWELRKVWEKFYAE